MAATAVYYGEQDIDMADARCAFLGHYAETDPYVDEDGLVLLESDAPPRRLARSSSTATPATTHWFAEPDRPEHDPAAAALAWDRTARLPPHPPPPAALSAQTCGQRSTEVGLSAGWSRPWRSSATAAPRSSGPAPSRRIAHEGAGDDDAVGLDGGGAGVGRPWRCRSP